MNEESTFRPKSPYAASKLYAHHMGNLYRDSFGMHISNGILFNHESPRRGENFVSRKISLAVASIYLGLQKRLKLGNIDATRDWGHARDYMEAVRLMLDAMEPRDYVVATGRSFTVAHFAKLAFEHLGMESTKYIDIDPTLYRPNEVKDLLGDPSKILNDLGWKPQTTFEMLVSEMVNSDLALMKTKV